MKFGISILFFFLCSCAAGPNYRPAPIIVPEKYKETPKGWKVAEPKDAEDSGKWWQVFKDLELNTLEEQLDISNQSIAIVFAQYKQATALVDKAFAAYFPTLSGTSSVTRSESEFRSSSSSSGALSASDAISTSSDGKGVSSALISRVGPVNHYTASLNALWEPDLWGTVRRAVESNKAGAEASAAQVAATRLAMQGMLAQTYFQLRALDAVQKLLNDTVVDYRNALRLAKNRYTQGVAARLDVIQAETQLQTAEIQATDLKINRQQFEHAIAVLIGTPPACFSIPSKVLALVAPSIPIQVPSTLLERRPDIGQAERLAAQANAQIGVAMAAFYPTLSLTGSKGYSSNRISHLLTEPAKFWSLGAQLSEWVFDGGLRCANVEIAKAEFEKAAANYRQTVLTAFQDVEDNLVSLNALKTEEEIQKRTVASAEMALNITLNQYKAGTVYYL